MKLIQLIFIFLSVTWGLFFTHSCNKDSALNDSGAEIEFYILDSFSTVAGTDQILNNTVVLNDSALIHYNQIISYDSINHTFLVDESVTETLFQDGGLKYFFKAFAVCIDREVIYTGYFWPSISSTIKQWFVIDPLNYFNNNEIKVQLAYPTDEFAGDYSDVRNDRRMINILQRDGKLKN